jgi:Rod binding domain-containing protein
LSDIVAGMTQISTSGDEAGATGGKTGKKDTPEAIAKAASQFEALLIGQLLQSARAGDEEGWFGTDAGDAGSTMTEMSEQVLSSTLASKGGLGLAKLVTKGMEKTSEQTHRVKQEG